MAVPASLVCVVSSLKLCEDGTRHPIADEALEALRLNPFARVRIKGRPNLGGA